MKNPRMCRTILEKRPDDEPIDRYMAGLPISELRVAWRAIVIDEVSRTPTLREMATALEIVHRRLVLGEVDWVPPEPDPVPLRERNWGKGRNN